LVESVKVQKAPAQRRGPGCLTKVSYMNLCAVLVVWSDGVV
jgi:hypothetical protein